MGGLTYVELTKGAVNGIKDTEENMAAKRRASSKLAPVTRPAPANVAHSVPLEKSTVGTAVGIIRECMNDLMDSVAGVITVTSGRHLWMLAMEPVQV